MGSGIEGTTLTLVGMVGTFVATLVAGGYWFRGIDADVDKKIEASRDKTLSEGGETIRGIRTFIELVEDKVGELALRTEREFVRRTDFQNSVDGFTTSINQLRAEIQDSRKELKEEYSSLRGLLVQIIQGRQGKD